ncbi:hypothetical protein V9T40_006583 [Parthenolecanium corni]|uniref:Uncharacterized protein n=1 Tax=Parthenolecanium corni TaxID=536013 RepID=A0AAN9TMZ3_9HEMI
MQKYVHLLFIVLTVQLLDIISLCDGVTVSKGNTSSDTAETSHKFHSTNPSGLTNSKGYSSIGKLCKCCEAGKILSQEDEDECLPVGNRILPIAVWEENYSNFEIVQNEKCSTCLGEKNRTRIMLNNSNSNDPDNYKLYNNGSLFAIIDNQTWFYSFGNFCIDYFSKDYKYMPRPLVCDPPTNDTSNDVFSEDDSSEDGSSEDDSSKDEMVKPKLDDFGMGTSILFLTVTLCLFLVTPKLRQSLPDKCALCHMATLALTYGFSIVAKHYTSSTFSCTFIGKFLTYD